MKCRLIHIIFLCCFINELFAQSVVVDYTVDPSLCLQQPVAITNNTQNSIRYLWDFCHDDLKQTPTLSDYATVSLASVPEGIRTVREGDIYYTFVTSRLTNHLFRIKGGTTLTVGSAGDIDDLGTSGLSTPMDIRLAKDGGIWYALIINDGSGKITRYRFGNGLASAPDQITDLGNFGRLETGLRAFDVVNDGIDWYGVIGNSGNNKIYVIKFGNSLASIGSPTSMEFTSGSVQLPRGIAVINDGSDWYAFINSYSTNQIVRVKFGNDLMTVPASSDVSNIYSIAVPFELMVVKEGIDYVCYAVSENGDLHYLNFGSSLSGSLANSTNRGTLGSLASSSAIELIRTEPGWTGLVMNYSTRKITKLEFQATCTYVTKQTSIESEPAFSYSGSGTFAIELNAYDALSAKTSVVKSLIVGALTAPSLDFSINDARCLGSQNVFSATSGFSLYEWNFGDNITAAGSASDVSHTYAANGYKNVSLKATALNGCKTIAEHSIEIQNPPIADFDLPLTTTCTNKTSNFINTGTYDNISNVVFKWALDGVPVSSTQDLSIAFTSTETKQILLEAIVPGCVSQKIKSVEVKTGPNVDFEYLHNCWGEQVTFQNLTTGSGVTGYSWSFGDGASSNLADPKHQFGAVGDFNVTLKANNDVGCETQKTSILKVRNQPLTDFSVTDFTENIAQLLAGQDLSGSSDHVTNWHWVFGDNTESSEQQTNKIFKAPGQYLTVLSVTTQQGCVSSVSKTITVIASVSPSISISANGSVCQGEDLLINNYTQNSIRYLWDFCQDDLKQIPIVSDFGTVASANVPEGIRTVKEGDNYYTFVTSRLSNHLFRIKAGTTLSVSSGSDIEDLGTAGLSNPMDIRIAKDGGTWYALIINDGNGKITRYRFGNGLENAPDQVTDLGNFGRLETGLRAFDLINDGVNWYGVIGNSNNHKIYVIRFGTNLGSITSPTSIEFVTGAIQLPRGISMINDGTGWYAFVNSYSTSQIVRINFGNDLMSIPQSSSVSNVYPISTPFELMAVKEGLNYVCYAVSEDGSLHYLDFGSTISGVLINSANRGTFSGSLASSSAIELIRTEPYWTGLVMNYSTRKITKLEFKATCAYVTKQTSTEREPPVFFKSSGNFSIELNAYHANGTKVSASKGVAVSTLTSPLVDFTIAENTTCLSVAALFKSNGDNATSYSWSFGDNLIDNTNSASVSHQYASAGEKHVMLGVMSQNGCANSIRKTITIYNPPSSSFTFPSAPLCTNQSYTFTNISTSDPGSDPTWQWSIDGTPISTDKDLVRSFTSTAASTIKLTASIPGCSSTSEQTFGPLIPGPLVDFDVLGKCDQQDIKFTSSITGDINSLGWTFGDNTSSTTTNPGKTFPAAGKYNVTLSTTSPSGCANSKTKEVTIYSNPHPSFTVDGAPNSCTNTATRFANTTPGLPDSEVSSWLWTFNIGSTSTAKDPTFTYATPGNYNISLKATTPEGCTGSTQQTVPILQGPTALITNTPTCAGTSANFSATGTGIDSYYWETGTSFYTVANPAHTFNVPGSYAMTLTVKAANKCEYSTVKLLTVPAALTPDFSVTKNCVGFDALLTDITSGADPVVDREWNVSGFANKTGQQPTYTFNTPGPQSIKLSVKARSGCSYTRTKTINVVPAPVANFSIDPQSGAVPLTSQFQNTSSSANIFQWKFGQEQGQSNQSSPSYTYENPGDYTVEMIASNTEGCSSTATRLVSAQVPVPDIEVRAINYSANPDGSLKLIVTLANNGNTIVNNLPVDIDISGLTSLRETIPGPIKPTALFNLVVPSTFPRPETFAYFCAATAVDGDVAPNNNRVCKELDSKTTAFQSYPNPANSSLNISWVAAAGTPVKVTIVDLFGKIHLETSITSGDGLNEQAWSVESVESGLYLLQIDAAGIRNTQRILIQH